MNEILMEIEYFAPSNQGPVSKI